MRELTVLLPLYNGVDQSQLDTVSILKRKDLIVQTYDISSLNEFAEWLNTIHRRVIAFELTVVNHNL